MIDLSTLTTERRNNETFNLDQMTVAEALIKMNNEDKKVAFAVEEALPNIEPVISSAIEAFNKGGRLIYMGAGTSGRLGVLDAAECVPTFGVPATQVIGLIAGGDKAMTVSVEGAEDSLELGRQDLIDLKLLKSYSKLIFELFPILILLSLLKILVHNQLQLEIRHVLKFQH